MSIEFLGHKTALLDFIVTTIQREIRITGCDIVDLFCGTGAVSLAFKKSGYQVTANDHLVWCSTFAEAVLLNNGEPSFGNVLPLIGTPDKRSLITTPYDQVLGYLNSLPPFKGFIYQNYSPESHKYSNVERMYFTRENAAQIDAIRIKIREWEPLLTRGEMAVLLTDLIRAANSVSNIAGTYGCYLKHWKERAIRPIRLVRSPTFHSSSTHRVFCMDANKLVKQINGTVFYADPPYTKRQYAAYYHLLETIAVGDQPEIEGSTGLRPWKDKASDYCYKSKAPQALENLVLNLNCKHFFLSYNEDGQIPHSSIMEILSRHGDVRVFETDYRRYKSSALPHRGKEVKERLYHLKFK